MIVDEGASRGLQVVGSGDGLEVHPLPAGARLGGFVYWQVHMHALGGSRFLAMSTNEELGAMLRLWNSAYRDQDPGGTLPCDDVELGIIAGYRADMAGWQRVRPAVMRGWRRVRIVDAGGGEAGVRLAHPMVTDIAVELWDIRSRQQRQKASDLERQAFHRIRTHLGALGYAGFAKDQAFVHEVRDWLVGQGLNGTRHNIAEAVYLLKGQRRKSAKSGG